MRSAHAEPLNLLTGTWQLILNDTEALPSTELAMLLHPGANRLFADAEPVGGFANRWLNLVTVLLAILAWTPWTP